MCAQVASLELEKHKLGKVMCIDFVVVILSLVTYIQWCGLVRMQLCIDVQIPSWLKGLGGAAVYIGGLPYNVETCEEYTQYIV